MKKILSIFIIFSFVFITSCSNNENINKTNEGNIDYSSMQSKIEKKAEKIEIVLFHATQRCFSCNLMEELTKKTLEENFKDDFDSWKITFKEINWEDPINQDIVMQYRATWLSIFINSIIDSKDNIVEEKNLWRYLQNEDQFKEYLSEKLKNL